MADPQDQQPSPQQSSVPDHLSDLRIRPASAAPTSAPTSSDTSDLTAQTLQQARTQLPQPPLAPPWEDEPRLPTPPTSALGKAYQQFTSFLGEHERHFSDAVLAPFRQGLDNMAEDLQRAGETGHTKTGGVLTGPARALTTAAGEALRMVPVGKDVKETVEMSITPPELSPEAHALATEIKTGKKVAKTAEREAVDVSGVRARPVTRNASGESAASQEAINRVASEKAQGKTRVSIDTRSGKETPLVGTDAVDVKPATSYHRIVERSPNGEVVLAEGSKARPTPQAAKPKAPTSAETLYHGTSASAVDSIKKHGLKQRHGVPNVTTDKSEAMEFAKTSTKSGDKPVVISLKPSANEFFDNGELGEGFGKSSYRLSTKNVIGPEHIGDVTEVPKENVGEYDLGEINTEPPKPPEEPPAEKKAPSGDDEPKHEPVGVHEDDLPRRARYQDVDFSAQDLQDSGKTVTAETIRKDYAGGDKNASIYKAHIPMEDLPSPQFVKNEDDEFSNEENFDRGEYSRPRVGVPIKVEVDKDGKMTILDGNHRAQVWSEQDHEYAPAWVVDRRGPNIEQLSEDEKAERAEAAEEEAKQKPVSDDENVVVRRGELSKDGAYFSSKGESTYYDPDTEGVEKYHIGDARVADTNDEGIRQNILREALKDKSLTPEERTRIQNLYDTNDIISYMDNDELPLPAAAKRLGYDGIKVWENDDITKPSSIFMWNTDKAKKLGGEATKVGEPFEADAYHATSTGELKHGEGGTFFSPEPTPEYGDNVLKSKIKFNNALKVEDQVEAARHLLSKEDAEKVEDIITSQIPLNEIDADAGFRQVDQMIAKAAREKGHDGIVYTQPNSLSREEYVALDKNAIAKTESAGTSEEHIQRALKEMQTSPKAAKSEPKPLPKLYHGTKSGDFESFDLKHAGTSDAGLVGKAVYFTPTKQQAQQFAESSYYGKGDKPTVLEAEVGLTNPLYVDDGKLPDGRTLSQIHPNGITKDSAAAIEKEIKAAGYDGVVFRINGEVSQVAAYDTKGIKKTGPAADKAKPDWEIHDLNKKNDIKSEPGYVYHATNAERAQDIANEGLKIHRPWHGTDQSTWPDGSMDKRSYFTDKAHQAWQFAPEDGKPALLRMKQDPKIHQRESTGDFYSKKKIDADKLEVLGSDQQWHSMAELRGEPAAEKYPGFKKVYHGTNAEFESPKPGSWLTESPTQAAAHGKNVKEFYIKPENPVDLRPGAKPFNAEKGEPDFSIEHKPGFHEGVSYKSTPSAKIYTPEQMEQMHKFNIAGTKPERHVEFADAVKNTPGAEVNNKGELTVDLVRHQQPEQEGSPSVRSGVFFLPEKKSPYQRHYTTGRAGYGGSQRIEGRETFKNPIIAKGASGGKVPERAYDHVEGKGAYAKMRSDVIDAAVQPQWGVNATEARDAKVKGVAKVLEKYGGNPDDAWHIVDVSGKGNTLAYAVQEHIVAAKLRAAGHDAVIGYNTVKGQSRLSEVFHLGIEDYPTPTSMNPPSWKAAETKAVEPADAYTPEQARAISHYDSTYQKAGDTVDGRKVRTHVPNMSSIDASLGVRPGAYEVLSGVREVPMSHFSEQPPSKPQEYIKDLMGQIKQSGELNPLIVGIDKDGPYIIEGAHRFDALNQMGAKSFPAVVAVDLTKGGAKAPEVAAGINKEAGEKLGKSTDVNDPEFKKWFEGSKVVDKEGKPLTVYHGTDKPFSKVNMKKGAQGIFWVSSDKDAIARGEAGASSRNTILPMHVNLKNPAGWEEYDKLTLGELKARGYDGAILPDEETGHFNAFVFNPDQVRINKAAAAKLGGKTKPQYETVYRGEGGTSKKGGPYWSPSKDFATQFTQTGQEKELKQAAIQKSHIYEPKELPYAGDPDEIDAAVAEAKKRGFKAVRLSEGQNQPNSVYVFDKSALQSGKK